MNQALQPRFVSDPLNTYRRKRTLIASEFLYNLKNYKVRTLM